MSELGKQIIDSLKPTPTINDYIWKGPKVNHEQKEYRLVDCSEEELKRFVAHCDEMLYNQDKKNPGRLVLLDIVEDQIQRCRAELLVRWLRKEKNFSQVTCLDSVRAVINKNRATIPNVEHLPIGEMMGGIPDEYSRVPARLILSACLDTLGLFDNSHITLNFILRLGVWLTQAEMQNDYPEGLYIKDPETGKAVNRLALAKKELGINPDLILKVNPTGLSYSELRSMCNLRKAKYSELDPEQLTVLSSKVLYKFYDQCVAQAQAWKDKKAEILEVAAHKGYTLYNNVVVE